MASLTKRPASSSKGKGEEVGMHEFPALFTIDGSNRHEGKQ